MSADTQAKKHICTWGDCGKAFSRSDHLQRHMLNHSPEGSTCERCRAHFKRPDLLERHMQRHVQKDEEAGGPGRGIVETRKRMWLDADGQTIVSKRPVRAPPSPPKSNPEIDFDDMQMQQPQESSHVDVNQQHLFGMMPTNSMHDQSAPGQDISDFLANSSWGMQPLQPLVTTTQQNTQLWDDAFAPDTGKSLCRVTSLSRLHQIRLSGASNLSLYCVRSISLLRPIRLSLASDPSLYCPRSLSLLRQITLFVLSDHCHHRVNSASALLLLRLSASSLLLGSSSIQS
jgi:hypothetical protein